MTAVCHIWIPAGRTDEFGRAAKSVAWRTNPEEAIAGNKRPRRVVAKRTKEVRQ
jgi:hypothetical protein